MRQISKILPVVLVFALVAGVCQPAACADAAGVKLSKKAIKLNKGKTAVLKVKGAKKKAKWSVRSGKKVVKLQTRKKSSVRIKALKPGAAKVQCQVGKKKLICKVTVKAKKADAKDVEASPTANAPSAAPTATALPTAPMEPSASPSAEPTATVYDPHAYELDTMFTPGPMAEYDRLQVEVGVYKSYLYPEKHFLVDFEQWAEMQFFGTGIWREDIEQIHIADSKKVPESVIGKFDLSEKQNGSVMAWYTDQDGDGKYEMTIGQDGGVIANQNSACLFAQIRNREKEQEGGEPFLTGLENLDTSHVTNMRGMFAYAMTRVREFSLGDHFDTSHVTDMSYMFYDFSYGSLYNLHLGAGFDVSAVQNVTGMFDSTGAGRHLKCYVKDEATKDWFVARKEKTKWHIGVLASETFSPDNPDWGFIVEP